MTDGEDASPAETIAEDRHHRRKPRRLLTTATSRRDDKTKALVYQRQHES
jgi:hypothetical protein